MEASTQRGAPDQHIDKRTKRADTTRDPEGSSLNTESPNETVAMDYTLCDDLPPLLKSMFDDARTWLCRNSVFNNFLPPDNDQWRDLLLDRLQTELEKRRDLVAVHVEYHTKDHLMWDLRRWAVKEVGTNDGTYNVGVEEHKLTTTVIDEDANNFHAWSHRKWVLRTFYGDHKGELWEDELFYCAKIIEKDPFNSFAWDQARACGDLDHANKVDDYFRGKRNEEVAFAIKAIEDEPGNQCPWTHFRGLYTAHSGSMALDRRVSSVILHVLEKERDRLKDPRTMDEGFEYSMNARGIINALNVLLDLLCYGYDSMIDDDEVGNKIIDVLVALSPDCPSDDTCLERIFSVLEYVEKDLTASGLAWKIAGSELFSRGFPVIQNSFLSQMEKIEYQPNGGK